MTSLFGRMLPLFVGIWRVEDLFTEAVAHVFERRPDICLGWLHEIGAISTFDDERPPRARVSTQKSFVALEEHDRDSRPNMLVEIHRASDDEDSESRTELVMIESKLGSWEGPEQLKRYAAHLENLSGEKKTLIYITRAYDPKDKENILAGTCGVNFRQLRWHDFYKFLQKQKGEKDALVEEVMLFMEEQGMSRSHRLSTTDLMAMFGVPRAIEVFDETLVDEVKVELEAFSGGKASIFQAQRQIRNFGRYILLAGLRGAAIFVGYGMNTDDGYPAAIIQLETYSRAEGREEWIAAMKKIALRGNWRDNNLDYSATWSNIICTKSLADFLHEEDHIFAIKQFFIESIRQLRRELTDFKKENPDLPWNGGN